MIDILQASRRGATLNQPPKPPVSCRVFRYFTPAAAARKSNAVSVSTDSFGVGKLGHTIALLRCHVVESHFSSSVF